MSFLLDVGFFALLFFLLVFIHELGHFLMARWVGIRVEKFSIGMGPSVWAKKIGDTEYRLAALPLGGYVKMSGDEPGKDYSEEEKQVGFLTKSPPQKLLVVFGGPLFNLILPLFVFGLLLAVGSPSIESRVGYVEEGSAAEEAGLMPGDLVTSIDGRSVDQWQRLDDYIRPKANETIELKVERKNVVTGESESLTLEATPVLGEGMNRFGQSVEVGRLGVSPRYDVPLVFYEGEDSPIAKAGAKKYDRIVEVEGVKLDTQSQVERALEAHAEKESIGLKLKSEDGQQTRDLNVEWLQDQSLSPMARLGVLPLDAVIGFVAEKVNAPELEPQLGVCVDNTGPAKAAGIQAGDRIVSIGGKDVQKWEDITTHIQASSGEPVEVKWSRDGELMTSNISALRTTLFDPIRGKDNPHSVQEVFRIGVGPRFEREDPVVYRQSFNPVVWAQEGFSKSWELVYLTGLAIGKLVTGQLSIKNLGSPIMIFNVAGNSYRLAGGGGDGWIAFLKTLALLSITLGLVNLLPIPVLDGGHAVFFTLEWIRGKPISLKFLEIATQVGLVVLLGLFSVVLYNDFMRYDLVGGALNGFIRFTNAVFYQCA